MSSLDFRKQAAQQDRRRSARFIVEVPAFIQTVVGKRPCHISNISDQGAMIETDNAPPAGIAACLTMGETEIFCTVKWSDKGKCGVEFENPLLDTTLAAIATEQVQPQGPVADVGRIQMGRKRGRLVSGD